MIQRLRKLRDEGYTLSSSATDPITGALAAVIKLSSHDEEAMLQSVMKALEYQGVFRPFYARYLQGVQSAIAIRQHALSTGEKHPDSEQKVIDSTTISLEVRSETREDTS